MVSAKFGRTRSTGSAAGTEHVVSGRLSGSDDSVMLAPDAGGIYLLFLRAYTTSTGAGRNIQQRLIIAPEESLYGTTVSATSKVYESASTADTGIKLTANDDSTITIAPSGSSYSVHYVLIKLSE